MSNSKSSNSSGISLLVLVGIAFLVLKLTGYIDWSWWLVTLPFWGGVVIIIILLILYVAYLFFSKTFKDW